MKKKGHEKEPNHERWLLTYSDLITLLMIFFVIMYASSNIDTTKYKAVSDSFSVVFNGTGKTIVGDDNSPSISETKPTINQETTEKSKIEEIKNQVDTYLKNNGMKGTVSTNIDERGLVISLNNTLFFDIGKAEIKPDSQKKLIEIGNILNKINNYIRIEGHTDNIPIKNDRFQSNWQLSCERAANVTMLLIDKAGIPPQKLSAVGYGEWRPVDSNKDERGRIRNRRVDIVIMDSKFNQIENNKK
ncbi:flagellar motor protein MotB [Clostridium lundense]|uniref:flagellar motor protein MotB n=1 Tax=Clostridium lundense TaxID=319475 RepID=UPI0004861EC8|nr:flagellar motor protein MotB [Clostridium lundense]